MNTMKAIITKSIKFTIVDDTAYKSPDGKEQSNKWSYYVGYNDSN